MAITFYQAVGGPVPGFEAEIYLRGAGGLPDGLTYRDIVIYAERVAAGTQTVDTMSAAQGSEAEAIAAFGATSPGAHMASLIWRFLEPETGKAKCRVFTVPIAEKSTGIAAAQTLTFAAGNATAAGTWVFSVGGHRISVGVSAGDTPTEQAAAFVVAYDVLAEHETPPITSGSVLAVMTLTFTAKGLLGNSVGLSTLTTPDIGTTATWGAATMAGGLGAQESDTAASLTAMLATKTPVLCHPWYDNTTNELIVAHVVTKSLAGSELGSTMVWANDDTSTNLASNADTLDDDDAERILCAGIKGTETWDGAIAAEYAALQASEPHLARSLNGLKMQGVNVPVAADTFTAAQKKSLLESGVTPLSIPTGGDIIEVVRAVSMRTEYGVMDFALMTVADYVRDSLSGGLQAAFSRASIVANGAVTTTAEHVTTPKAVKTKAKSICLGLQKAGYLTDVETHWQNVVDELDGSTYKIVIPWEMVPQWHNTMMRLDVEV